MRIQMVLLSFAVMALAMLCVNASSSVGTVTANVFVVSCPFSVNLGLLPVYAKFNTINTNFTVYSFSSCTSNSLTGNFIIINRSSSSMVYTQSVGSGAISNTPATVPLSFATNGLPPGNYIGNLTFYEDGYSNSSLKNFELLSLANVTIVNLTVPSSVTVGSTLALYATLKNTGELAALNVNLTVNITGPNSFNTVYTPPLGYNSLEPGASQSSTILKSGVTPSVGTYTVNAFASYNANGTVETSNVVSVQFSVTQPSPSPGGGGGGGGGGPPPSPITPIPGVTITTIPFSTSATVGQGLTSQIGIRNTATVPEIVNFTVGSNYTSLLNLSSKSLYILPGQTVEVTTTFRTTSSTAPGTYVIPLTISTTLVNGTDPKQTEYITFTVYSNLKNGLRIIGQSYLTNSLNTLSGIIEIGNYGNTSIKNGTLLTVLPLPSVLNASQITAYGLPNNITKSSDGYAIKWLVSTLPAGQLVYVYYSISNPLHLNLIAYPQNIFTVPTQVPTMSTLRVVDISAPTFYTDSVNKIEASIFYTGTSTQPISFYLAGPPSVTITNPTQIVNVSPNQLLARSFNISVGNYTGTQLFYLYITSSQANITTQVPVLVVSRQAASSTLQTQQLKSNLAMAELVLEIIAGSAIVFIILLTVYMARHRPPKANPREPGA